MSKIQFGNHPPKISGSKPRAASDPRPGVRVCGLRPPLDDAQARVVFISSGAWRARELARWARFWARGGADDGDER